MRPALPCLTSPYGLSQTQKTIWLLPGVRSKGVGIQVLDWYVIEYQWSEVQYEIDFKSQAASHLCFTHRFYLYNSHP